MAEDTINSAATPAPRRQGSGEYQQRSEQRGNRYERNDRGNDRGPGGGGRRGHPRKFRKKVCRFCTNKDMVMDYKNVEVLERFITERGKILPRRITGTCARHQRQLSRAIKRARTMSLLPYTVQ